MGMRCRREKVGHVHSHHVSMVVKLVAKKAGWWARWRCLSMEAECVADAQRCIAELQAKVMALQLRVEHLEAENSRLRKVGLVEDEEPQGPLNGTGSGTENSSNSEQGDGRGRRKQRNDSAGGDMAHYSRRLVALKLMYLGAGYQGFASQSGGVKTVEQALFSALEHTRLLVGSRAEAGYSRCGRTDKGVSAAGQVVALRLRSSRKDAGGGPGQGLERDRVEAARACRGEEQEVAAMAAAEEVNGEVDYVGVLNRALPGDIRVLGWCPVPESFSARFSCLGREYSYFFLEQGLDVGLMQEACGKLAGEHDFRNFCKMDAANVHNYVRTINEIGVFPVRSSEGMWVLRLKGNAFLWHQVRCIAAVLFMVGEGKEPPGIVDELLDIDRIGRKPQYVIASEKPLLLRSCSFQGVAFSCSQEAARQLRSHVDSLLKETLVSAELLREVVGQLPEAREPISRKCGGRHIPLLLRPTEPSYTDRQRKQTSFLKGVMA